MPAKHVAKSTRRPDALLVTQDLVRLADRLGFPMDILLERARLSEKHIAARQFSALNRRDLSRLYEVIVLESERQACRERNMSPALPERGFQQMCHSLIACETLREAIETSGVFFDVFTHGQTEVGMTTRADRCRFHMDSVSDMPDSAHNCLVTVAGLHSFAQIFSWLVGHDLEIGEVMVRHHAAVADIWFSSLLAGHVQPSQPSNGFTFNAAFLDSRVVRSRAELMELIQFFPFDLMPPDYDGWLLAERVQSYFLAALHRGEVPRQRDIAAAFNISLTTLRRRLAEENRSFQGIKDHCRCEVAQALLVESPETLSQIADRLAFTDIANFRRSFRRWTGQSPAEYRRFARPKWEGTKR